MDPAAMRRQKAFNLAAIADALQPVAEAWLKLCVEHLPVRDRTLAAPQTKYRDQLASLPVGEPEKTAAVLPRSARGRRLREGHLTATQRKFLQEGLGLGSYHVATETYQYLAPVGHRPENPTRGFSAASVFYIASH